MEKGENESQRREEKEEDRRQYERNSDDRYRGPPKTSRMAEHTLSTLWR